MTPLVVLFVAGGRWFGEPDEWRGIVRHARDWRQVEAERALLERVLDDEFERRPFDRLVHGSCRSPAGTGAPQGADKWVEFWAVGRGVQAVGYPAAFKALGPSAGPKRTWTFLTDWHPAHDGKLLALPGGVGTQRAVEMATGLGIPVRDERGWRTGGQGR